MKLDESQTVSNVLELAVEEDAGIVSLNNPTCVDFMGVPHGQAAQLQLTLELDVRYSKIAYLRTLGSESKNIL